ncbi:Tn3 family transposase [Salmonella enterica]
MSSDEHFSTTLSLLGYCIQSIAMAESCPGTSRASLENMQAWYIRDETYSAALAELVK